MRRFKFLMVFVLSLALAPAGALCQCQVTEFLTSSATGLTAGEHQYDTTIADFNGDKLNDIALVNYDAVNIVFGKGGRPTSLSVTDRTIPAMRGSGNITAGDVDRDGDVDLLTANSNNHLLELFLNDGKGNFSAPIVISSGVGYTPLGGPNPVELADLDNDGDLDIINADSIANRVNVFRNQMPDSGLSFVLEQQVHAPSRPLALAHGDLNGDGMNDFVVAQDLSNSFAIFTNDGTGRFQMQTRTSPNGAWGIAAADADGDGDLDVLVQSDDDKAIKVYRNQNGVIASTGEVLATLLNYPRDFKVADLNRDTKPDLIALSGHTSGQIEIYLNQSTSAGMSFANRRVHAIPAAYSNSFHVSVGDLDSDGLLDVHALLHKYSSPDMFMHLWNDSEVVCTPPQFLIGLNYLYQAGQWKITDFSAPVTVTTNSGAWIYPYAGVTDPSGQILSLDATVRDELGNEIALADFQGARISSLAYGNVAYAMMNFQPRAAGSFFIRFTARSSSGAQSSAETEIRISDAGNAAPNLYNQLYKFDSHDLSFLAYDQATVPYASDLELLPLSMGIDSTKVVLSAQWIDRGMPRPVTELPGYRNPYSIGGSNFSYNYFYFRPAPQTTYTLRVRVSDLRGGVTEKELKYIIQ